jgi:hypothetical protein
MTTDLTTPEAAAAEETEQALAMLDTATALIIEDGVQYESAASLLQMVKGRAKQLEERRTEITRPMNEALRSINALFAKPKEMYAIAETKIKAGLVGYQQETERKQRAEIARQQEERQAQLLAEAEERARLAEAEGDQAKADRIIEAAFIPEAAPPPLTAYTPPPPKVGGISTRKVWKYRVTDPTAIPREYLMVNDGMLSALARTGKANANVPGIEFYEDTVVASSSR